MEMRRQLDAKKIYLQRPPNTKVFQTKYDIIVHSAQQFLGGQQTFVLNFHLTKSHYALLLPQEKKEVKVYPDNKINTKINCQNTWRFTSSSWQQ